MWKRDASPAPVNEPTAFTPPPTPTAPPAGPRQGDTRAADNIVMNLGKSVTIKGELSASEDLMLYGQMEGKVTLPNHTLTVGPDADIRAEITVSTVVIMGAVRGNVTASNKVDVRATGSVTGDIVSPRIVIAEGGQVLGSVKVNSEKAQGTRRTA